MTDAGELYQEIVGAGASIRPRAAMGAAGERLLLADVHLHRATVAELRQGEQVVTESASFTVSTRQ